MADNSVTQEATALWVELFGAPPPRADGATILRVIMESLPAVDYDGFANDSLVVAGVVTPRRA